MRPILLLTLLFFLGGCALAPKTAATRSAETELAQVRKQIEDIHGNRDAAAFGALHTDDAVCEWRGRSSAITGRAALVSSQSERWMARREVRLNLQVSELRVHAERAYEYGSYEETWIDPHGRRVTEFGRYVTSYARESDGQWRIARTFGFTDLTATKQVSE